ncbi:MAG: hypothetical protein WA990_01410 [Rubrobacteraceae bacterium]
MELSVALVIAAFAGGIFGAAIGGQPVLAIATMATVVVIVRIIGGGI